MFIPVHPTWKEKYGNEMCINTDNIVSLNGFPDRATHISLFNGEKVIDFGVHEDYNDLKEYLFPTSPISELLAFGEHDLEAKTKD